MGEVKRRGMIKRTFRIEMDSYRCLTVCEWKRRERVEIIKKLHKPGRKAWTRIRGETWGQQELELRPTDLLFSAYFMIVSSTAPMSIWFTSENMVTYMGVISLLRW